MPCGPQTPEGAGSIPRMGSCGSLDTPPASCWWDSVLRSHSRRQATQRSLAIPAACVSQRRSLYSSQHKAVRGARARSSSSRVGLSRRTVARFFRTLHCLLRRTRGARRSRIGTSFAARRSTTLATLCSVRRSVIRAPASARARRVHGVSPAPSFRRATVIRQSRAVPQSIPRASRTPKVPSVEPARRWDAPPRDPATH